MRDNWNPYHQMPPPAPQPSCEAISVLTQQQDQALRWGVEAKQCVVLQGRLLVSATWSGESEMNVVRGSAVSRTERAAGLWSGVEPTTRSGRVRRDLICICLEWQWLGWLEAGVGGAIAPPV